MSGFIAGGTAAAFTLSNDGFWPDIDAEAVREAQRINPSVTNKRLEVAIVGALINVNRLLKPLKVSWQAEGYATLADVPAEQLNGASILQAQYQRAIYCSTSVEVAERYRSYDTTNTGEKNAEELTASIDELRRDARWAVSDLLGMRRTTVELI
ncbi:head completion/stabilization protein [Pseudomonas sp. M30-35]|uniref:head completion/stabilization protein n=1 Tax=Pseudomonas sp. M30-35 TaxID=1981174 RepID=UPI000B3CD7C6|nr:head completion/stabilization protein [Pseudomonas sp. M30-35]ARU88297.1 head completion/stabilization protein [Pseudomonas sp. M30-35]